MDTRWTKSQNRGRAKLKTILGACAAVLVAAVVAGCGGDDSSSGGTDTASTSTGQCDQLNVMVWEGYTPDSVVKPFEQETGVKINPTYMADVNQQIAKLVAGGTEEFDVIMATSDIGRTLVDADLIKPLDLSRIPSYDKLFDYTKDTYSFDDEIWAVSQAWGVNPYLYNTEDTATKPTSLEVQWSPEMKNKLGLWDDYTLLYMGATVLGMDDNPGVFDLSDEQLEQIKEKMLELKPNVRTIWKSGGDLIQKFSTGEVSGSLGWNYIYQQLHPKGFPIEQVVFEDQGPQGWNDANALSSGIDADCEQAAYDWIEHVISPKAQAAMADETGYSPSNPGAKEFMSPELIKSTYMNDPTVIQDRAFIRTDPVRREKYIEVAEEIIQGLQ